MKFIIGGQAPRVFQSHPAWGAWIEIQRAPRLYLLDVSHPAWGAWIEIGGVVDTAFRQKVAPRMGCVD